MMNVWLIHKPDRRNEVEPIYRESITTKAVSH